MVGFVLVLTLAGCCGTTARVLSLSGSGRVVTLEEDLAGFEKVEVSHTFEVDITQAESFGVVVRVDENLRQYLRVVRQGDTLVIGLAPGSSPNLGRATLEAEITMPELAGLALSGASQVTITGFESAGPLDVDVSGASELRGDIEAGRARLRVSGSSQLRLKGSAEDMTVDGSGASRIDLSDFAVGDAEITLSGASTGRVRASGRLDAKASGASRLTYAGGPALGNIETSGGASVKPE
jgi:hypothetical protein